MRLAAFAVLTAFATLWMGALSADTLERYGTDLLPGSYCGKSDTDRIAITILPHDEERDPAAADLRIDVNGHDHLAQTAYSYFGSIKAPPAHFVLGIMPLDANTEGDDILAFKNGEDRWLTRKGTTYRPCS